MKMRKLLHANFCSMLPQSVTKEASDTTIILQSIFKLVD